MTGFWTYISRCACWNAHSLKEMIKINVSQCWNQTTRGMDVTAEIRTRHQEMTSSLPLWPLTSLLLISVKTRGGKLMCYSLEIVSKVVAPLCRAFFNRKWNRVTRISTLSNSKLNWEQTRLIRQLCMHKLIHSRSMAGFPLIKKKKRFYCPTNHGVPVTARHCCDSTPPHLII